MVSDRTADRDDSAPLAKRLVEGDRDTRRDHSTVGGYDPVNMRRVQLDPDAGIDRDHAPPRTGWPSVADACKPGRTRPISLRPWKPEDTPRFRALLDDPEVWKYMPQPHPGPMTEDMASGLIAISGDETHHEVRAILWDGEPVGQVRWEFRGDGGAELSYWLGRAWWGRGITGQAVRQFVDQATAAARFKTIMARVHRLNPASQGVLRHAGLNLVGPMPEARDWLLFERRS